MIIDWSEYKKSPSYRATVDSYLAGKKLEAAQPRREWQPASVSNTMIAICNKHGLDVRGMTAADAAAALKEHTRPQPNPLTAAEIAANEAECLRVFGPV